ncbi:MAG: DUF488 domain-containing protein [Candidatus Hydrogenedentes bacterium]|nr:DUF488 domain-containing protein [Candidatus Hydrogenedentota bacterium]
MMLYTIGHSNHAFLHLVDLLRMHGVVTVADVRSRPYSRHCPQFNRDALRKSLAAHSIDYIFLGKELGGKPDDPECYAADGKPDYGHMAQRPAFREGLDRVERLMKDAKTAILCAEEDPSRCHRRHLIARVLSGEGVHVEHIRGDGSLVPETVLAAKDAAGAPSQLTLFAAGSAEGNTP